MKKLSFNRIAGVLFVILVIAACAGDIDRFIPNPDVMIKGDIGRFFEAARDDISTKRNIHMSFPTPVVTPRKTVLIFPPNSLENYQGEVANGVVEIELLELLTKGEILLYGIPTNSRDKLLYSGGEFHISATQNGQPLRLRSGMQVRILTDVQGETPNPRMELFYGVKEADDFGRDSIYTWEEADNTPGTWDNVTVREWVAVADSQQIITGFGYQCFSDSLRWINFDVFADIPEDQKTDVCVTLPDEYGNVNTMVFLVFNDLNAVINLPGNPETLQFCNYYTKFLQLGIPIGASVTFVVISEQGEDCYFFALVTSVIVDDHLEEIVPVKTPLDEIKAAIMML